MSHPLREQDGRAGGRHLLLPWDHDQAHKQGSNKSENLRTSGKLAGLEGGCTAMSYCYQTLDKTDSLQSQCLTAHGVQVG